MKNQSALVKVKGDNFSIISSHPNTEKRVVLATEVLRKHNIAPSILMRGADFHIEKSSGISVMDDFFIYYIPFQNWRHLKKLYEMLILS